MGSNRFCGLLVRVPGYRSRGLRFDSLCYQIFWEVVGLEQGPLSLVNTIEELFGRNSSGSSLELREYSQEDPLRWPCDTVHQQKLALTSQTSSGRSAGIVRSRTKGTEFSSIMWSTYCIASYHSTCNSLSVKLMSRDCVVKFEAQIFCHSA
jgi:hypothetical protein